MVIVGVAVTFSFGRTAYQREIVWSIEQLGGNAHYDWQLSGRMGPTTFGDYCREVFSNPALLSDVILVDLVGTQADDEDLEKVARLVGLRYLFIADTEISDSAVQQFKASHPECRVQR